MRRKLVAFIGLTIIATQLGGCVVYGRPYHPYYWRGGYYYR